MTTPETAPVEVTQADRELLDRLTIALSDEEKLFYIARHRLTPRQDGLREALVEAAAERIKMAWIEYNLPIGMGLFRKMAEETLKIAALSDTSPLANDTGALREEIARLTDERDEALAGPWPKWASDLLDILREYTGPCREDAEEGVDLPEEMRIWLDGYRDEMVKVAALSPDDGEGK